MSVLTIVASALLLVIGASAQVDPGASPTPLSHLCVTEGHITEPSVSQLVITDVRTRAVLTQKTTSTAELDFRYLGPTAIQEPLESGIVRQQIGIKLRAHDPCNLVYAMWRIQPVSEVVVSVKSNPTLYTSAQCGNDGYHNITPKTLAAVHAPQLNSQHSLQATLSNTVLTVTIDKLLVWQGPLPALAFQVDGPVGFRTDNSKFDLQFYAVQPTQPQPCGPA